MADVEQLIRGAEQQRQQRARWAGRDMRSGVVAGLALVSLAVLGGCATTPVATSDASPVTPNRVFAGEQLTGRPGKATLIIKRDSGFQGSACYLRIFVDSAPVADLDRGEKVVLHLEPGDHLLTVSPNSIVCGRRVATTNAVLIGGQTATFRIGYGLIELFVQPGGSF